MDPRQLAELETTCYLAQDWEGMRALYADDFVFIAPDGTRIEGADAYLEYTKGEAAAFPGGSYEDEITAVDGPVVVQTWTWSGTFDADLTLPSGTVLEATGAPLRIEGCSIGRIEDGRFIFAQRYADRLSVMQQLGIIPT
jgi:predicted ester cyclase